MKKLRAQDNMKEFDPTSEQHWPLLIVKAVDGGCTTELQIENATNGEVTRVTTTEDEEMDDDAMERALREAFQAAWNNLKSAAIREDSVHDYTDESDRRKK